MSERLPLRIGIILDWATAVHARGVGVSSDGLPDLPGTVADQPALPRRDVAYPQDNGRVVGAL